jgi:hypothetical protein
MFQLRHLSIWGGRVVLEDRTRPGSVPMVWSELSATTETTATSPSAYNFELKADHKDVAAMTAVGSFDLDLLHLTLGESNLAIRSDPTQPASGVPAQVQSLLREYQVNGKVGIRGTGDLPLGGMNAATFDVTVDVTDASARFPKTGTPLQGVAVRVHGLKQAPGDPITVRVERLEASSGASRLRLAPESQPSLVIDRDENRWALADVAGAFEFADPEERRDAPPFGLAGMLAFAASGSGAIIPPAGRTMLQAADYQATLVPSRVRVHPPKFPLPLENVGGDGGARVELRPGAVSVKNLAARYGGDDVLVRAARIPIPEDPRDLKRSFAVEEIDGRIHFRHPSAEYPGKFNKVIANLRPQGPFEVGGGSFVRVTRVPPAEDGTTPEKPRRADWFFGISTDAGSLTLTKKLLTFANLRGDATVSNLLVDVPRAEFSLLGGAGSFSGKIVPKKPFPVEGGRLALREVDLGELGVLLQPEKPSDKLAGRGFLNATFAGAFTADPTVPPAQSLHGQGEFEAIEGQFWTLPVLGDIHARTKKAGGNGNGNGGATLGELAGTFRIANRSVLIENAALTSPALGLVGSGTVGFDKSLDLRVVAAPLGDWRDHVKRTRIPIVSDVAGEVAGGVQRLLSTATRTLLYQFRVIGTADHPKVETIPAPVLTDPAAFLFGRMLDEHRKQRLLESVKNTPPM